MEHREEGGCEETDQTRALNVMILVDAELPIFIIVFEPGGTATPRSFAPCMGPGVIRNNQESGVGNQHRW
jgi:hypothetical protein